MVLLFVGSLFDNPLDSDLFIPTAVRIAILLTAGALLVAIVERRNLGHIGQSHLFKKILSWAVMAPTFLAAVFIGGPIGALVMAFLIVQGLSEYTRLVGIARRYAWLLVASGLATLAFTGLLAEYFLFAPLVFFVLVTAMPIVTGDVRDAHRQVTSSLFGYIYIPFLLSYIVFIKVVEPYGAEMLIIVGVSIALSDIVAFTVGSVVGGPKIAPNVSPNKTVAGAVGNVIGAYLAWAIMSFAVPNEWATATWLIVPAVTGAAALYGDLIQSFVKRDFGVKDAGTLLPGFGGLLDRIDSLLVALPITYYAIIMIQHFIG
jgi:phosphatidate cytidylyltransferase